MIAPDELLSWTDSQIEDEIRRLAPEGSTVLCEWQENAWSARVERPSEGARSVLHAAVNVDRRMALYAVYGHLWLELQPRPLKASAWDASVTRPSVAAVSRYVHSTFRDPEDLDPAEVAAVYGIPPSTQRRI